MIVFFAYCVYEGLNCARNISLYDLLTNFSTRVEGGGCKDKVRHNIFVTKFSNYFLSTHVICNKFE